jgi:hypothetical protein
MSEQNGQAQSPVRVSFGAREDDSIPLSWADRMLKTWRKTNPAAFGKALAKAAISEDSDT